VSKPKPLKLQQFIPFRLNRLAFEVGQQLAETCRQRFGIDPPEWRILATLASHEPCTAQYVVRSTHMHKTRVSRAVAQLVEQGYVARGGSAGDARQRPLRLTARGRRVHAQIVPLARAHERELMSCLRPAQRAAFLEAVERLEQAFGFGGDA
jgi:DNA-binding MarR family transcriptional regulator